MSLRVRCPHKEESYRRGPAVLTPVEDTLTCFLKAECLPVADTT